MTTPPIFAHPKILILAVAVPVLLLKCWIAAKTFGTNDIAHWGDFTAAVRSDGPVGIYGVTFENSFYNHPPLMGYVLWLINGVQNLGIPYRFTIRALSSVADVGSALVLFALLRPRQGVVEATVAGLLIAASPLLFVVSGFHGNTDPDFVFLTLLALYLLVDGRMPVLAGAAIALAIGIKIVPVVVIPALAVYAWKQGRRVRARFAAGFGAVFALTWGPAVLQELPAIRSHVIGYSGNGYSLWGFMQIGHWLGDPWWVPVLGGAGRVLLVLVCALVPAIAVWRRPDVVLPAAAWAFIVFLGFATTFGVQYLVWPVALGFLVRFGLAAVYDLTAGVVLIEVYDRWSGGLPWNRAIASEFTTGEKIALLVPWALLLALAVRATSTIFRDPGADEHSTGDHRPTGGPVPTGRRNTDRTPEPDNLFNALPVAPDLPPGATPRPGTDLVRRGRSDREETNAAQDE